MYPKLFCLVCLFVCFPPKGTSDFQVIPIQGERWTTGKSFKKYMEERSIISLMRFFVGVIANEFVKYEKNNSQQLNIQ